jgi:hypothetical protein
MRSVQQAIAHAGHAGTLAACAAAAACVLIASGAATLLMQGAPGSHASAWWMSALALATMMSAPLLMARSSARYTTLKTAATLIVAMSAMNVVPAYLKGFQQGSAVATLMLLSGAVLLYYWHRCARSDSKSVHHVEQSVALTRSSGITALLAVLAGLSSGSLARFQLFTLCGVSGSGGAQPLWQIAILFVAICALACVADRSNRHGNTMLMALYITRAALIAVLATVDSPTLAPLASKIFLLLDCLTIPALANLQGNSKSALSTTCPGIAHHLGMVMGAALSTSPYFFGDGFVVLFALSAASNLLCAASLAMHRTSHHPNRVPAHRYHHEAHSS